MKILILGGFLGSGKTSILLHLAKYIIGDKTQSAAKIVILENEIGEISVDDKILRGSGYQVSNMFSGCICCTMSGDLILGLQDIKRDYDPELILIEATGVAYPHNIRQTIASSMPDVECRVTCVADAKRWKRLLRPMEMLLKDQLDAAEVILINKIDMIDEETLLQTETSIKSFNPTAEIFKISAAQQIDTKIFDTMLGDLKRSLNK